MFGAIFLLPAMAAWFNQGRPLVVARKAAAADANDGSAAALGTRRDAAVGV
ncbi:hypothetical protein D3C78_1638930 [compost metagenome]